MQPKHSQQGRHLYEHPVSLLITPFTLRPPQNNATPLHLAAKYGHKELIRHLCLAGCDVNAMTENGCTADNVAAKACQGELVSLLRHLREVCVLATSMELIHVAMAD